MIQLRVAFAKKSCARETIKKNEQQQELRIFGVCVCECCCAVVVVVAVC